MDKVSMSHLFPSWDIKQNVLLKSYLNSWWRHKLSDFSWIKEKNKEKKIQKFDYLKIKKSFLSLEGYQLVKNKNLIKK